jgi:integrase/recombinase XerD
MKSPVQLYLRVRLPNGKYPYLRAAYASNGRIRPNHAVHNGRAVEFPAAAYHLRYWCDGKRVRGSGSRVSGGIRQPDCTVRQGG